MARLSSANPPSSSTDPTAINLSRMLARLQQILITPDSETEHRLRISGLERVKVGTNLEYARSLLIRLEQDAQGIRVQKTKQDTQAELVRKRELLQRLRERLQELNELSEYESRVDDSEGEDLLGEDTPSEETDSHISGAETISEAESPLDPPPPDVVPAQQQPISQSTKEPESTLRARHKAERAELLGDSATSTGTSTSATLTTTESLLTHNRTEQESLTDSLLQMASALKNSSLSFSSSLEEEKAVLESATKGLDNNELGLEAASRKMGTLRSMSEGKGWWGRMLLYAWIFGLMVVAILVVFVMPKLRFSPAW